MEVCNEQQKEVKSIYIVREGPIIEVILRAMSISELFKERNREKKAKN